MLQKRVHRDIVHYPTLKTVLAIENVLRGSRAPMSRNQILARLPTKVMRSTLNLALDYMKKRDMITETGRGFVWTFASGSASGETGSGESRIADIKKAALPVLNKHDVKRAALFGSTARGEARRDSDIDVLVEFRGAKTLFDLGGLKRELEDVLKRQVDIVTYRSIDPRFRKGILTDKVNLL